MNGGLITPTGRVRNRAGLHLRYTFGIPEDNRVPFVMLGQLPYVFADSDRLRRGIGHRGCSLGD